MVFNWYTNVYTYIEHSCFWVPVFFLFFLSWIIVTRNCKKFPVSPIHSASHGIYNIFYFMSLIRVHKISSTIEFILHFSSNRCMQRTQVSLLQRFTSCQNHNSIEPEHIKNKQNKMFAQRRLRSLGAMVILWFCRDTAQLWHWRVLRPPLAFSRKVIYTFWDLLIKFVNRI